MVSDFSSLALTSALSMNASREKIKEVIDERLKSSKLDTKKQKDIEIDKNMVIVNDPRMFTVGTSFETHPPYPKLGNRIAYTNNNSKFH